MTDDNELLRRFAADGSEGALAEVVRRHVDFVYGAALRQTRGNVALAQDVTQAVFTDLARKAPALAQHEVLVGWLYTATRYAAGKAIRAESRRQAREREAGIMSTVSAGGDVSAEWERLRPVIDEAMGELKERERAALLLRFFEKKPLAEVGAALALTESAARSCVDRALDKLHGALARRGITSTAAALGVALANQVSVAAPAGLAATVTGVAVTGSAATGGWIVFMSMTKLQMGIAAVVVAAGVTGYAVQADANAELRQEIAVLETEQPATAALRNENQQLARAAAEAETLRQDDVEFKALEQRVAAMRAANDEKARVVQARARAQASALDQQIREEDRLAQLHLDELNRQGNLLVESYKTSVARSRDDSLPAPARAEADQAAKATLVEIQAKQREVKAFLESKRQQLAEWAAQLRALSPGVVLPPPLSSNAGTLRLSSRSTGEAAPPAQAPGDTTFRSHP